MALTLAKRSKPKKDVASLVDSRLPGVIKDVQGSQVCGNSGGLREFMAAEHSRLDELLVRCARGAGQFDVATYEEFRGLLLRHISIEEKILLPAAQRRRSGTPLALASRLRLDHGVLATLMMPPPVASTFYAVRAVLDAHNPLEEAAGGVYEQCEDLLGLEAEDLLARCRATPRVPVSPWIDSPKVLAAAKRVLMRAGYEDSLLNPREEAQE